MKKILMGIVLLFILLQEQSVYATNISHFNVQLGDKNQETTELGEPISLSISAVDENNMLVRDYTGSVLIFSETDPRAEWSSDFEYNMYEFTANDAGVVVLEGGIMFSQEGNQSLHVYDLHDVTNSIFGIDEILVVEATEEVNIVEGSTEEDAKLINLFTSISEGNEEEDTGLLDLLRSIVTEEDETSEQSNELTETSSFEFTTVEAGETSFFNSVNELVSGLEDSSDDNTAQSIPVSTVTESATEETISQNTKVGDMIMTSYRKKREYNRGVTRVVTQTKEESMKDKVMDMVLTSFRKVREYNKGITRAPAKIEELSVTEKVKGMILTSFRIEKTYITRSR